MNLTKKICLYFAFATMIVSCNRPVNNVAITAKPMQYIETFNLPPCPAITLEFYSKMSHKSDSLPAEKKIEITDSKVIEQILTLIHSLPNDGEIMKKLGDVAITNVIFNYPDKTLFFTFYNQSIQTPATSFYAPQREEEKALYTLIMSHLNKGSL